MNIPVPVRSFDVVMVIDRRGFESSTLRIRMLGGFASRENMKNVLILTFLTFALSKSNVDVQRNAINVQRKDVYHAWMDKALPIEQRVSTLLG